MMKKLTIFHIGDVHYPDVEGKTIGDEKDKGFDEKTINKISPASLTLVLKSLAAKADESEKQCLFLLSGDITTEGNSEKYRDFVGKFDELILKNHDFSQIHVVPGNHDIQQDLVGKNQQYVHMIETWNTVCKDHKILVHDSLREETVTMGGDTSVTVFSLNSCIGCGGKREIIGDLKTNILDCYKNDAIEDLNFYEKLDTPAVDISHLTELVSSIGNASHGKDIPVVLVHHNLLPQSDPRVEIYTELINSGSMREHLLKADVPLLLCHGHIHDDPIEIITSPNGKGSLIITSAPRIIEGFNAITFFAGEKGYLLGCIVEHHRLKRGGVVYVENSFRVPFCKPSDFSSKGHDHVAKCLAVLQCNKPERGSNYMNSLKEKHINYQRKTVQSVLEEALWFDLVEINNKDEVDFDDWHITKVVP